MFYLASFTKQVLCDMSKRKLRSVLAIFCIAWGTLTVALLLAVGHGFHQASKKNILNITENVISLMPGETSKAYRGKPAGQALHIRARDLFSLPEHLPQIIEVSPVFINNSAKLTFQNKQLQKSVFGIGPGFMQMRKVQIEHPGRFFNRLDLRQEKRVVVLGHKLKTELFGDVDTLGKRILINNIAFIVVGVIQQFTQNVYNWYDTAALMPYSTYLAINGDVDVNVVAIAPDTHANAAVLERDLRSYFAYRYHFDPSDGTAVKIFSAAKIMRFFLWFFLAIQAFLGVCGLLTLGAGSIGIANLMFLNVTERTREIGLRKTLGACNWQILWQILVEAFVIVVLGGMVGLAVTYLIILILQYLPLPEWLGMPTISWVSMLAIISVLAFFGVAAGYFPAQRAAQMDPVEAMRK